MTSVSSQLSPEGETITGVPSEDAAGSVIGWLSVAGSVVADSVVAGAVVAGSEAGASVTPSAGLSCLFFAVTA